MPDDPSSLLAPIRADIEETVFVYSLDGAGKRTHPVSAAMSRHARSLLAAVEAALKLADKLEPQGPPSSALEEDRMWIRQECANMIREAITAALAGEEAGDA